jgi:hypothetical protein
MGADGVFPAANIMLIALLKTAADVLSYASLRQRSQNRQVATLRVSTLIVCGTGQPD